jgi:DNA repair protein RadA/Sms
MVIFGEIGLSGEVRAVSQGDLRLKEAAKLGFEQALVPNRPREVKSRKGGAQKAPGDGLRMREIGHLQDLLALFDVPNAQPSEGE